jgi:hypothetical protein
VLGQETADTGIVCSRKHWSLKLSKSISLPYTITTPRIFKAHGLNVGKDNRKEDGCLLGCCAI